MNKELELWQFIDKRLTRGENVMLLVVAESSGSSPGRQGYKMAVAADGELFGSIGGGVMEVNLVEESRSFLRNAATRRRGDAGTSLLIEQVHRKDVVGSSGMICSGKQTVIFKLLMSDYKETVESIAIALKGRQPNKLGITPNDFSIGPPEGGTQNLPPEGGTQNAPEGRTSSNPKSKIQNPKWGGFTFDRISDTDFTYTERIGFKNDLYIIGGGHCALALSELMSKMDFQISLFDDRPELNTIEKNQFAHEIKIIDSYQTVAQFVPAGERSYVVVMTLGYRSDGDVIRSLIDKDFKYFGVLGSNAKMSVMLKELVKEGLPREMLDRIRTPVGIAINSRTPEEIAVSIAAEIISVKNAE
ncbi:MAG: XdhC family protein [Pyrinomonadaceae bacterium]